MKPFSLYACPDNDAGIVLPTTSDIVKNIATEPAVFEKASEKTVSVDLKSLVLPTTNKQIDNEYTDREETTGKSQSTFLSSTNSNKATGLETSEQTTTNDVTVAIAGNESTTKLPEPYIMNTTANNISVVTPAATVGFSEDAITSTNGTATSITKEEGVPRSSTRMTSTTPSVVDETSSTIELPTTSPAVTKKEGASEASTRQKGTNKERTTQYATSPGSSKERPSLTIAPVSPTDKQVTVEKRVLSAQSNSTPLIVDKESNKQQSTLHFTRVDTTEEAVISPTPVKTTHPFVMSPTVESKSESPGFTVPSTTDPGTAGLLSKTNFHSLMKNGFIMFSVLC